MRLKRLVLAAAIASAASTGAVARAQATDGAGLLALGNDQLVGELTTRYDAGLATSLDNALIAANDPRYLWALETKVQCGIALGFMKSSTRDETSITNCARAYELMRRVPAPPVTQTAPPPPPPARRPDFCNDQLVGTVFFDFDSTEISPEATTTLNNVAQQAGACGWRDISVVGHTDQAGTDQYNLVLSRARADAVAAVLQGKIAAGTAISVDAKGEANPRVPLSDGTRSPENRRVEITAK